MGNFTPLGLRKFNSMGSWCTNLSNYMGGWCLRKLNSMGGWVKTKVTIVSSSLKVEMHFTCRTQGLANARERMGNFTPLDLRKIEFYG